MDVTFDDLTDLEQVFYDQGYKEGYEHGRIHGLIEGRALGVLKGIEVWEQVAFYGAFAQFWQNVASTGPPLLDDEKRSRITRHTTQLLHLISKYPLHNPSQGRHISNITRADDECALPPASLHPEPPEEVLTSSLDMSSIQSKYKVLCATIGCGPRLPVAASIPSIQTRKEPLRAQESAKRGAQLDLEYEERVIPKREHAVWSVD